MPLRAKLRSGFTTAAMPPRISVEERFGGAVGRCRAATACAGSAPPNQLTWWSSGPGRAAPSWHSAWRVPAGGSSILEAGPFWDPDQDWVSDEAGSRHLYWTETRIIGGEDPVVMGANNSGRGVGGSMVHYAGYAPRFHPSRFRASTASDGVGVDWPIAYDDLQAALRAARERAPGRRASTGPGAIRTAIRTRRRTRSRVLWGSTLRAMEGARKVGIEFKVGPVAIANGSSATVPIASTAASVCRAAR